MSFPSWSRGSWAINITLSHQCLWSIIKYFVWLCNILCNSSGRPVVFCFFKDAKQIISAVSNCYRNKISKMLVGRNSNSSQCCTCLLPPCHTPYKYVRCHQENCQGGCFSIIVFIWRAFRCPKAKRLTQSTPSPLLTEGLTGESEREGFILMFSPKLYFPYLKCLQFLQNKVRAKNHMLKKKKNE